MADEKKKEEVNPEKNSKIPQDEKHFIGVSASSIPEGEIMSDSFRKTDISSSYHEDLKRKKRKYLIYLISFLVHLVVIIVLSFYSYIERNLLAAQKVPENMQIVDLEEYVPLAPQEEVKQEEKQDNMKIEEDTMTQRATPDTAENTMNANPEGSDTGKTLSNGEEVSYAGQSEVGEMPIFPEKEIRSRIVYPKLANEQGIEGTVILLLYVDKEGLVRKVEILKDPGFGFGESAAKACLGIKATPPKDINGNAIAAKVRYPVRFTLKH
jgi:periplasmic protein TonB